MFVLNRCPTRDRLLSWGLQTDPLCLLCNLLPESRNHLFFCCSFSSGIWRNLASKLRFAITSDDWDDNLHALSRYT
ncbi:BnaC06g03830D [Brassica napus]|uniref:BnaC06g03830D protein n=3 Tax=Brassica TaxID=3705 RepID=A0A078HHD9_BRANA